MGQYLPTEVACVPHLLYGKHVEGCGPCRMWKSCYLNWSNGVSCKTLSHMCGSCYFPKFLLCEGSLTLIYMASFMFLETPYDSLSIMVKTFGA